MPAAAPASTVCVKQSLKIEQRQAKKLNDANLLSIQDEYSLTHYSTP
jgi:hypothetical protein